MMTMPTTSPAQDEKDQPTAEPLEIVTRVFLRWEDDHWAAISVDYTIVGTGPTMNDAIVDMIALIEDYLSWCIRDGLSLDEARRHISPAWALRLRGEVALGRVMKRIKHRPLASRTTMSVPVAQHC